MIKLNSRRFRVLGIRYATLDHLTLNLVVDLANYPGGLAEIACVNAVDFSLRPPHPNNIEGGPEMEFHEEHELLRPSLQAIPGGDGEVFDPPIRFGLLILDQSYVIAERFDIRTFRPEARH